MPEAYRGLGWQHGALGMQRLGAMLAPVTFVLPDGRQVSPMHVAPWADEPDIADQPGILRRLRGEWPCVPFGYSLPGDGSPPDWADLMGAAAPDEEVHGHSANTEWDWEETSEGALALSITYPEGSPIRRLRRTIAPDTEAAAVDISLTVETRVACNLPLGLHATFRLPGRVGDARIEPGQFRIGRTFPGTVEPAAPLFAIDRQFDTLRAVPGRDLTTVDAAQVPLPVATEELLQLDGIQGRAALAYRSEGFRVILEWDAASFPSLLLWYSNRGRPAPPWNGRHLALGMEPICSPFGLGIATARADNPIARAGTPTTRAFSAGEVWTTRYRLSAEPL
ncbi:MAG: hypothetical protein ACTS3R_11070 [Inquilinaceae bacterium]